MKNPFEIKTPEQNTAQEIVDLFVDVFPDFGQVREPGHTFLNGPRGSGKSMMFRYMQPDCQKIVNRCEAYQLDYFSVYVGIKQTNINNTDLNRLEDNAAIIFNEHLLCLFTMANVLNSVNDVFGVQLDDVTSEISKFFTKTFCYYVSLSGYNNLTDIEEISNRKGGEIVLSMIEILEAMENECLQYCKRITVDKNITRPYTGALTDFNFFVRPLILELKKVSLFPQGKPLYVLIDDAGYLNLPQTKVLNTWVSYRSTKDICLKISTQLDYKSHLTASDKRIDAPHDYSEINISTIYSSSSSKYYDRVKEIVQKRIKRYLGEDIDPRDFFPVNQKQEDQIEKIKEEIKAKFANAPRDYVAGDAARRYARPEYIKRLQGIHKSGFYYSYAGFDQLVAVSSGIIRHFLAPAQEMFASELSNSTDGTVKCITPSIQDETIKQYSDNFLHNEFDDIRKDKGLEERYGDVSDKLYNLVNALGQLFHMILVSDSSERRVFSVALTDNPDKELYEVLDICEQFGYLHRGSIGNKSGTGRNRLYVLCRVLAPYFKLDPTSFAGYKFMSCDTLKIALTDKNKFLRAFEKKIGNNVEGQLKLFDDFMDE